MEVTAVTAQVPVAAPLPVQGAAVPALGPPSARSSPAEALPPALEITYDFNRELHQIIFTLRRPDTGEVVRQVPPKAILEFATYLLHQSTRALDVTT